jgi:hypothetical protein
LLLLGSKVRALLLDDKGQELVFKTILSDSEVNESALSLDFRRVVGVGKLGVEVKVELVGEGEFLVSHLDVLVLSLLDNSAGVHGLNNGVNAVLKVLN